MQSPFQQGKKSKVNVPFYTPPPRLYGQTPAEIIKEARAAVMTGPAVGIRPVFTSRPFTPKDTERTLFGNVKRRDKRPPSSCSLKNLQSQEVSSHVKLPSIDFASKRKSHSIFHYSSNLSLDNLTEDYDAENVEGATEPDFEKLPAWKKSHSCPKEGRTVKLPFQLNRRSLTAKNLGVSYDTDDKFELKSELGTQRIDSKIKLSSAKTHDDHYRFRDISGGRVGGSGGGGDHDDVNYFESSSLEQDKVQEKLELPTNLETVKAQVLESEPSKPSTADTTGCHVATDNSAIKAPTHQKKAEPGDQKPEKTTNHQVSNDETDESQVSARDDNNKNNSLMEKCVATERKSAYLLSLHENFKKPTLEKSVNSIPLEILELYQTAEYYGVDLQNKGQNHQSDETQTKTLKDRVKECSQKTDNLEKDAQKTCDGSLSSGTTNKEDKTKSTTGDSTKSHKAKENNKEKAYERWIRKQQQTSDAVLPQQTSQETWDMFWQNCYYKAKSDDVDKATDENASDKCQNVNDTEKFRLLIAKLVELYKKGSDNALIYETNCQLYHILKRNQVTDEALKTKLLKALSLFAENENPEVLLSLARLIFCLKIDTSLTAACKMIFKVARFDANDHLFVHGEDVLELFMEGLGRASPLDCAESCIYGYGALKFLTMNYNILSRTLHLGALDLMILHLKLINTAYSENGSVGEQTQHALFQLTGVLRHVAAGEGALPLFITTNCISVICKSLELFQKDEDVVTNISRTLSLISTDESITQVLMSVENVLNLMIDLMDRYKENDKILIRLSFCLGNIVEHSDLARIQLLRNDTSLSILLGLLKFYIDKDLEISTGQNVDNSPCELSPEVVDDVIVKVIRIIANMSMNPIVGSNLSPVANEKKSITLSRLLSMLLLRKDPGITLLATLGCLNNVSYYCNSHSALIDVAQGVERVLGLPSEECQAEAARVLGNLTRHKEIRDLIFNTGGIGKLIQLLGSKDSEVVRCACGALVNMLLDSEGRQQFLVAKGIDRLVDAIERFSGDWSLASLAGRAIWNSCADDVSSAVSMNNMEQLLNTLATSLEEENWNDGDAAWEEFASIATDLLEKINYHFESA